MDKLTKVIGPAPHERTFPSLMEMLKGERQRTADVLSRSRTKPKKPRAASSGAKKRVPKTKTRLDDAQLRMISEASGISIEDLKRGG